MYEAEPLLNKQDLDGSRTKDNFVYVWRLPTQKYIGETLIRQLTLIYREGGKSDMTNIEIRKVQVNNFFTYIFFPI